MSINNPFNQPFNQPIRQQPLQQQRLNPLQKSNFSLNIQQSNRYAPNPEFISRLKNEMENSMLTKITDMVVFQGSGMILGMMQASNSVGPYFASQLLNTLSDASGIGFLKDSIATPLLSQWAGGKIAPPSLMGYFTASTIESLRSDYCQQHTFAKGKGKEQYLESLDVYQSQLEVYGDEFVDKIADNLNKQLGLKNQILETEIKKSIVGAFSKSDGRMLSIDQVKDAVVGPLKKSIATLNVNISKEKNPVRLKTLRRELLKQQGVLTTFDSGSLLTRSVQKVEDTYYGNHTLLGGLGHFSPGSGKSWLSIGSIVSGVGMATSLAPLLLQKISPKIKDKVEDFILGTPIVRSLYSDFKLTTFGKTPATWTQIIHSATEGACWSMENSK